MSALAAVTDLLAGSGLTLRRAWPRDASHLLLDLSAPTGPVAGQWFREPARAREVATATSRAARSPEHVQVLSGPTGTIVVQAGGADRRLRPLVELVHGPSAVLVAHRPERRAVVRHPDAAGGTAFTKVYRPGRTAAPTRPPPGLRTPAVLAVDEERGLVTAAALPGVSLHDLLRHARARPEPVVAAAAATGSALAVLHRAAGADAARHDAAAEVQVLERWVTWAAAYGVLPDQASLWLEQARRLLAAPADPRTVLLHRDLHDKQVVVADDGVVGLLDFDLAAAGEAALDVANLLVHLELRAHQGLLSVEAADACAAAVLKAYRPDGAVRARLLAYSAAARLRLACVYGFRPDSRPDALRLLET